MSSSEKSFKATPRRREEARRKGQVFKSTEMVSALLLASFIGVLKFWFPSIIDKVMELFVHIYSMPYDWSINTVAAVSREVGLVVAQIMAPLLIVGALVATGANYVQVRSLFTVEPLKPQLSRISPISGAKRMFGVRAWVELAKALLKVIFIGYFIYATFRDNFEVFPAMARFTVGQGAVFIGGLVIDLGWKIALSFFIIAAIDFLYQWWDYEKNLRMSHQEIKQEYKQTEGNPQIKGEIKRKQRAMSLNRMIQDLKKADVIVTNPTHYAVALRYSPEEGDTAPIVVAKGADHLALRIKELAKEYEIVTVENRPLARALYDQAEIGQAIPTELYKAVAEVLAFVYRLKKKRFIM